MTSSPAATDRHLAELTGIAAKRLDDTPRTPPAVAAALREAGRPVGDATVLAVYEALCGTTIDHDADFLRRRNNHATWVSDVVAGRTLAGFSEWEEALR